jgi:ParB family chromosome partitioning protein
MNGNQKFENAIFWIDVDKVSPNPYQPRREFDEERLKDLAESIRQYGILQPLTVSRIEEERGDGGITVRYELVAGERRLRASKLAGLPQVPCIIRRGDDSKTKLELAIIENLQREDLNPVDRAKSFQRLAEEFSLKHGEIGKKISKSREYVSNTMRLLTLPQEILDALEQGRISEGHTRPLLMLGDRPEEQVTLFKEMLIRKMTVREAEGIARRIAFDKVRKKDRFHDPDIADMEGRLAESLGTRVHIEKKETGGKILIDFFSYEELQGILTILETKKSGVSGADPLFGIIPPPQRSALNEEAPLPQEERKTFTQDVFLNEERTNVFAENNKQEEVQNNFHNHFGEESVLPSSEPFLQNNTTTPHEDSLFKALAEDSYQKPAEVRDSYFLDDRAKEEVRRDEQDDDLYNIKNFSL